jgi:peptidoglycan lytic transglycosylase B
VSRMRRLVPVMIGILLSGCAAAGSQPRVQRSVPVATEATDQIQAGGFERWVANFRGEALAAGITPATFNRAFAGVEPLPHVIELDQAQPEVRLSFTDYVHRLDSLDRREGVRRHLAQNRGLLDVIGRRYGVQPRFIVALWAIETNFGKSPGDYPVIASLATLAYSGRRAALFTRELIAALRIVQRDHVAPTDLRGSWAGAMGQCQFMPTSFLRYAVSFDGRGRPDIWHSRADVFASIANYLAREGWRGDENWGRFVRVPQGLPSDLVGLDTRKSLAEWRRLGLRKAGGAPLPVSPVTASLLMPEGRDGPALLVYGNFRTLLRWNNSQAFATAVGLLADDAEIR